MAKANANGSGPNGNEKKRKRRRPKKRSQRNGHRRTQQQGILLQSLASSGNPSCPRSSSPPQDTVTTPVFRSNDQSTVSNIMQIGSGTYGKVFSAKSHGANVNVAIKQLMGLENPYVQLCAQREIMTLKLLKHANIINLLDVCKWGQEGETPTLSLVFELCMYDLHAMIFKYKDGKEDCFSLAEKKTIIGEILKGLEYIHSMNVLHRDLKPANILITMGGQVKIADFGLACNTSILEFEDSESYLTPNRFTLGFRPPEVLLGSQNYDTSADMWSVGFIFVELLLRESFSQKTSCKQLQNIVNLCGSITAHSWPGVDRLPEYEEAMTVMRHCENPSMLDPAFIARFPDAHTFVFFRDLIALNPRKRMSASEALQHDLFRHNPKPVELDLSKVQAPYLNHLEHPQ